MTASKKVRHVVQIPHPFPFPLSLSYNRDRERGIPPLALNLTEAQDHWRLLCARRASGRSRPDHRRPATLAIPRPVRPSRESLRVSVKLPEPGIELCLAGDTGSTSPDFTRSPTYVDRAPRWVFLRFIARIDSLALREAPCALGLNPTTVSRPEHTPPTT
jgi:hypothetical protein